MMENKENFLFPNQEKRKYRYKASNGYIQRRAKRLESISIPIFKGPRCADISDRSCFICGTNQTHLRKDRNYRPAWRKVDGKYICETCRGRERRSLTVPKPRKKTPKS